MIHKIHRVLCIAVFLLPMPSGYAAEMDTGWGAIDIHGFLSQGYLKSENNNFYAGTKDGTFQFNEFGINFSTELTDRLHTGLQLFSRDLGDLGNNIVKIDWAYADYRWKDWLGIRAGKIKTSSGFYNDTRDLDMVRTSIFLPQSLYDETMRDISMATDGIGVYGYIPLAALGNLNYQIYYGENGIETDSSMAKYMEDAAQSALIAVDASYNIGGSVEWVTPFDGLRLSGDFSTFDLDLLYQTTPQTPWVSNDIPVGTYFRYQMENTESTTVSLEYTLEKLTLVSEYGRFRTDVTGINQRSEEEVEEGYYGGLAYRFANWLEVGGYYSVYYPDRHDKEGESVETQGWPAHRAWQKDLALTVRIDLNEYWIVKCEGHWVNGTAQMLLLDNPEGFEEDSFLIAFKTTYYF